MADIVACHVSGRVYQNQSLVRPCGRSHYIERITHGDPHFTKVEDLLEGGRPPGAPARGTAVYAYEDSGACRAFWDAEQRAGTPSYDAPPRYYKVAMSAAYRVPALLVARISLRAKQGLPHADIVQEYWAAARPWLCWEFLAAEFTVVALVAAPAPEEVMRYKTNYEKDQARAQRLWPIRSIFGA